MKSNAAVFLLSLTTVFSSLSAFRRFEELSFQTAVLSLVFACLAWAAGSFTGYLIPPVRQGSTAIGRRIRWAAVVALVFGAGAGIWVEVGPVLMGLQALMAFASGLLIPAILGLKKDEGDGMRKAFGVALIGAACGAAYGPALPGALIGADTVLFISLLTLLAPFAEKTNLFFAAPRSFSRWVPILTIAVMVVAIHFVAPKAFRSNVSPTRSEIGEIFAADAVFQFRKDRKFDTYLIGSGASKRAAQISPEMMTKSVRNIAFHEGNARRRITSETRRFDLIQILVANEADGPSAVAAHFGSRAEGALTVESLRVYLDRLKDDGFFQVVGRMRGAKAQSTLSTIAEAWKKSARRDIDLHAVAVTDDADKEIVTVIVRMKPFTREERDQLGGILKVGAGNSWMLVSDSSGDVLTDDRPFPAGVAKASDEGRIALWGAIAMIVGLIVWVAVQERRKGILSHWQTASVATYFAGLGVSFAFFQVFFVLRAIRNWGMPERAPGFVLAAIFLSTAAGATLLAGHPGRRYGVRIQPLANFVFAVIFTYLGSAFFEPIVASGSEWLSAFVGMSVLIPFGLLGGSFLPNALEEAGEKLAPRVLSLLWALYVAGMALGIYAATAIGIESGLDVIFLAGLFCFAWVAIFSGLLRPWSVARTV